MTASAPLDSRAVHDLTRHILNLPALPVITTKLLQSVDNPSVSSNHIAGLLASDQALSARILRLANSPYYGFAHEIRTVHLAVTLLGNDTIANLALSMSVVNRFSQRFEDDRFDHTRFWEHSMSVGVLAERLAKRLRSRSTGSAYTAGILHDIGKLIIHEYLHPAYRQIENLVMLGGLSSATAEKQVLGTDHADIGGYLCRNWNIPEEITAAVARHHLDDNTDAGEVATLIALANRSVNRCGHTWPPREVTARECDLSGFVPFCRARGIDPIDSDILQKLVEEEHKHTLEFLLLLQEG
jgi:putative nucleotidyltransferase with HDIG domain